jgi:Cytochrome c7 and related cytochrome c
VALRRLFRDSGHLIRPALVLLGAVVVFMVVRAAVVPKNFGEYGHYRPAALGLVREHPLSFAGQDQCVVCHQDQADARKAGKHAKVACEACHGALEAHASDPSIVPKLPDAGKLCRTCHEKDTAKPAWFPQVVSAEHSGGVKCTVCHQPHNPHL